MRNNKHKTKTFILNKIIVLLGLLPAAITLPVQAANVNWNNPSSNNDFFDQDNWDNNSLPNLDDELYIHNTTVGNPVELNFVEYDLLTGLSSDKNTIAGSGGSIHLGSGNSNSAEMNITADSVGWTDPNPAHSVPPAPWSVRLEGSLSVGENEGKGTLSYDYDREISARIQFKALTVGSGVNSEGTVSLLGSGKTAAEQDQGKSAFIVEQASIATGGGTGIVEVNGNALDIASSVSNHTTPPQYALSLGSGTNSNGRMDVLNGGKVGVSMGSEQYINPMTVIGLGGGRGSLNITGTKVVGSETLQSRVIFGQGLELGNGIGSVGSINIKEGGLLTTSAAVLDANQISASVGINGGAGSVLVDGQGSLWQVSGAGGPTSGGVSELGKLHIGDTGTGNLTVANNAQVSIGRISYEDNAAGGKHIVFDNTLLGDLHLGVQAAGSGTLNIGAAEGSVAQGTGVLEAAKVIFGAGSGTVVFNHADSTGTYAFDPSLVSSAAGRGTLKQINGVTVLNTDQSSFAGATFVSGGTLVVNDALGGTMAVASSGTLAGVGRVGATTLNSGGIISPGVFASTTPSTLTINGDLTVQPGAKYAVNIEADGALANPYVADLIRVNGDAYLNGGQIDPTAGGDLSLYTVGSRWTVLSASGSVIGKFGSINQLAFVDLDHEYDAQNVYLVVLPNSDAGTGGRTGFCLPGMSANQCSVGSNIGEQNGGPIYNLFVATPKDRIEDAKKAFNQLSGEVHASVKGALLEDSRFLREAVNNRLLDQPAGNGAWIHTFGSWGQSDSNGNAGELKRDITGVFFGADTQVSDNWQAGFVGGYSKADINSNERNFSADRDDLHIGAYTQGKWGKVALRSGAGYSWHDFSTRRDVDIPNLSAYSPALKDRLTADYQASTIQLFTEGSYHLEINKATTLEPFVRVAYVHVNTDGFAEEGGIARLSSDGDNIDGVFSTVGTRLNRQFTLANGNQVKTWAMAGWRHVYNNTEPEANLNFQGHKSFRIKGSELAKDAVALEFGLEANITEAVTAGFMYNGQIGSDSKDHGAKAYINWRF